MVVNSDIVKKIKFIVKIITVIPMMIEGALSLWNKLQQELNGFI